MKIYVILPILRKENFEEITRRELEAVKRKDVEISVVSLENGPASIESAYDEEVAAPWILKRVKEGEEKGFDAVIIDCMGDPALYAAKETVKIPVVGPCQASLAIASTICDKFSIVTVLERLRFIFRRKVRDYGFESKLASIRAVEIPVLELEEKKAEVKTRLLSESKKALEEDGAGAIILGCTGMVGMARELQKSLEVPVIDPAVASLKMTEILVDMKIAQSKHEYPNPPEKQRTF